MKKGIVKYEVLSTIKMSIFETMNKNLFNFQLNCLLFKHFTLDEF
jgi:hypothetical protein